ncbi:hypothetical protein BT96DRAFT_186309 [Gymnopus androsaceus JB14]|uniref:Uncharacterized protein n=1 Tax=Gymnopus androsaceus JB14 TaxID=1447944 RepID=A0A6A4HB51_9AGAR|nr:hypothetical protein BT96DRAFT_186309 [Gymnopus androsaceus JB14]
MPVWCPLAPSASITAFISFLYKMLYMLRSIVTYSSSLCLDLSEKMARYFHAVHNAKLDKSTEAAASDWWHELRDGTLQEGSFKDGNIYRYHVVAHASTVDDVRLILSPFGTSDFYSHLSPFAALLNALRTLYVWTQSHESDAYPPQSDPTLYAALQKAQIPNRHQIMEQMRSIHTSLMSSLVQIKAATKYNRIWTPRRGGGGRSGGGDTLQKYGFDDGLDFGGWNDGTGGGDTGGAEGPSSSSAPDSLKEPQDGDILFVVPDESVGSIWSHDDSNEGIISVEISLQEGLNGPSPAQQVIDDWRRDKPSSMLVKSPPPPSVPLVPPYTRSTMSKPRLSLSSKFKLTDNTLHEKENRDVKSHARKRGPKTYVSLKRAGHRTAALRILGELNVSL